KPESPASEKPAATNGSAAAPASLLDKIVIDGRMARDASQQPYAKDLIGEFVGQVLDEGMGVSRDKMTSMKSRIAQIDELLSAQLNALMHHPDFQALEAAWRGLNYLVMNTETGGHL